jgi:hypothetical protein
MDDKSSETKQIVVTGEHGIKGRRRSRKNHKGGGSTQGGTIVQLNSTASTSSTANTLSVEGVNPAKIAQTAAPLMTGGKVKVILKEPLNKKKTNIVLSVNKVNTLKPLGEKTNKTRSKSSSKKILFSLKNLRKKLSTAKTIKKTSEEKSIGDIKKTLEEAKLIKVGSKAPEQMIRQIYNDYMTLKHKAL